ncbi:MAG: hypothetical protein WCC87_00665 [Candidatus Korobacteraceae bacterium]
MSNIAATTPFDYNPTGNWPVRIYYRNTDGNVKEWCLDTGLGGTVENWYAGGFPQQPAEHIAAISWKDKTRNNQIRVYLSDGSNITEWVFSAGWVKGALSVPGKYVAAACFGDVPALRVYVSDGTNITEWCNDDGSINWYKGNFQAKGGDLAAAAWETRGSYIRVYVINGGNVEEHCADPGSGWYNGGYTLPPGVVPSAVAATRWSQGWGSNYLDVYVADVRDNITRQTTAGGWTQDKTFQALGSSVATIVYDQGGWIKWEAYTMVNSVITERIYVAGLAWQNRSFPA